MLKMMRLFLIISFATSLPKTASGFEIDVFVSGQTASGTRLLNDVATCLKFEGVTSEARDQSTLLAVFETKYFTAPGPLKFDLGYHERFSGTIVITTSKPGYCTATCKVSLEFDRDSENRSDPLRPTVPPERIACFSDLRYVTSSLCGIDQLDGSNVVRLLTKKLYVTADPDTRHTVAKYNGKRLVGCRARRAPLEVKNALEPRHAPLRLEPQLGTIPVVPPIVLE